MLAGMRKTFALDLPGTSPMIQTARLKSAMPIALAGCFAIATAHRHGRTLLTGDPEILHHDVPCAVENPLPS